MGGMMGGAPNIPKTNIPGDIKQALQLFKKNQLPMFNRFFNNEDLLSGSRDIALGMQRELPQLTGGLRRMIGQLPDASALAGPLRDVYGSLAGIYRSQIQPTLQSGGALSQEQMNTQNQETYRQFAELGNLRGNQAIAQSLLNREQYRQQRFNTALDQGLGISGEERGLASSIQGLYGQNIGLQQALSGSIQGLESGAITPSLQTEQTAQQTFTGLEDPILQYFGQASARNQEAAANEAVAGANKGGSTLSTIGSIAGAAATAY